jgi:hypothetical protein
MKITGGRFASSGTHISKAKVTINFSIPAGQTCPTLTMINYTDATNEVVSST